MENLIFFVKNPLRVLRYKLKCIDSLYWKIEYLRYCTNKFFRYMPYVVKSLINKDENVVLIKGKMDYKDISAYEDYNTEHCAHEYDCCGCFYQTCTHYISLFNYHIFILSHNQNI